MIEINRYQSPRLREMDDIVLMPPPRQRNPIPIFEPLTRIGVPYAVVAPKKVIGVVENDEPDDVAPFSAPDEVSRAIGSHVAQFLSAEMTAGRIPKDFLPLQAGVGNVANGVIQGLADLRGLGPIQRARSIIDHCAHPAYRPYLNQYLTDSRKGHIRHYLRRCFKLHTNLLAHGEMLPGLAIDPAKS